MKKWPTPRAGNPGSRKPGTGGAVLSEEVKRQDSENSVCSPVREEVCSAPCSSDGEQLPLLSGMPIASESSVRGAATWPTPNAADTGRTEFNATNRIAQGHQRDLSTVIISGFPSTPTSATSTPSPDRATSSPAASPASRSVRPGSGSAKMTRATCGHTPFAYWSSQERRWDSSRTCLDFSQAATSEPFSETWPKRGSMRNGVCWEQTMSAPRIDASGCGYWPTYQTPSVEDASRQGSAEGWREWEEDGRTTQCRLRNQVQGYPTPRVSDGNGAGEHGTGGPDLRTVIARGTSTPQTWPSPDAAAMNVGADPKNHYARIQRARDEGKHPHSGNVLGIVAQTQGQTPGSLNPTWVEWLMGWPRGWTDSAHSVTDRCLSAWLQRSRTWLDRLE